MLSLSAIIADADMVSTGSQSSHIGNMKKLTSMLITQIHNEHAHLLLQPYALKQRILPHLILYVSTILDDAEMVGMDS